MARGRVLLLHDTNASFVRTDLGILESVYDVRSLDCSKGISALHVSRELRRADLSYSWFALGHAARAVFLGKILRRPSVVVAGGWDVIAMPEIGYGAARSRRGRARARYVLRHADRLLTFSSWSRETIRLLSGREAELVYLGVDTAMFLPGSKEDIVVTVGGVTHENLRRKGLRTFARAARFVPEMRFVIVGEHRDGAGDVLRSEAAPNLEFLGRLSDTSLRNLLGRAKVYVQPSYNEGFGLAVAEAMAAGCVPVVTMEGSLPEVAGDVGYYAPFGDAEAFGAMIRQAVVSNRGQAARERVERLFTVSNRRTRILAVVESLLER